MDKPKQFKPAQRKEKNYFELDSNKRLTGRAKGYDKDWERYRWRFLYYNKRCYACGSKAQVVDHIVAHKGNSELFRDTKNHMPLCVGCHSVVTGRFDRKKVQNLKGKVDWIERKRRDMKCNVSIFVLPYYKKDKVKGLGIVG